MQFDDIKSLYEDKDQLERIENRQRINLSEHACEVLQNDMMGISPAKKREREDEIPGGVINRVFGAYKEKAKVSIAHYLNSRKLKYEELFEDIADGEEKQHMISILIKECREKCILQTVRYRKEKGRGFNIRINKSNIEYLASPEGQKEAEYYSGRIGEYMKAVIEEFTELPYVERELIYFKSDIVETIKLAKSDHKALKIVLRQKHMVDGIEKNRVIYMKPWGIYRDKESMYNYLAGYSSSDGRKPWRTGSVRLTSIIECKSCSIGGMISKEKAAELEKIIQKKGVQYLSTERKEDRIVVEFTKTGENMYQSMLHLRPLYREKREEPERIYEFECTELQAEHYFFKFGEEARILAPDSLADRFLQKYQSAVKAYADKE